MSSTKKKMKKKHGCEFFLNFETRDEKIYLCNDAKMLSVLERYTFFAQKHFSIVNFMPMVAPAKDDTSQLQSHFT